MVAVVLAAAAIQQESALRDVVQMSLIVQGFLFVLQIQLARMQRAPMVAGVAHQIL
jgi:hypothetical protein